MMSKCNGTNAPPVPTRPWTPDRSLDGTLQRGEQCNALMPPPVPRPLLHAAAAWRGAQGVIG